MSASNNSTKANELSFTDELDDDDDKDEKAQNGESRTDLNNKALLMGLLKQINLLHETNSKIFRNLQETKGKWVKCLSRFSVDKSMWL